ncbi:hypothetical protein DMN91_009700 [Ooceraea biroi]|uniref:Uncharacterized protein n=1 Tax=Ooceraea biroi TaxID=2015173 RepID=A0A3L8DAE5_OOCBI|nr:hypothetical protein DMN91_009700 [Ooceraea biroi]
MYRRYNLYLFLTQALLALYFAKADPLGKLGESILIDSQDLSKEETSRQEMADVLSIGQYFQDIFSEHLEPLKIEFGHVYENPSEWEQKFERKDFDNNRYSGKVIISSFKVNLIE